MTQITPDELFQALLKLPPGHRKTLRVWGELIAVGLIEHRRKDKYVGKSPYREYVPQQTNFDATRTLLLIRFSESPSEKSRRMGLGFNLHEDYQVYAQEKERCKEQIRRLVSSLNEEAGEDIMLVANTRDDFGPQGPLAEELEHHVVVKLKYNPAALADTFKRLPEGPMMPRLIIDDTKGVYLSSNPDKCYDVSGARKMLVSMLFRKEEKATLKKLKKLYRDDETVTINAIAGINQQFGKKLFGKKLEEEDRLILHSRTGGYTLNTKKYQIERKS